MKGVTNATKGPADVVQNTSKVQILDTDLQVATDSQPGIMSAADHATLSTTASRIGTCFSGASYDGSTQKLTFTTTDGQTSETGPIGGSDRSSSWTAIAYFGGTGWNFKVGDLLVFDSVSSGEIYCVRGFFAVSAVQTSGSTQTVTLMGCGYSGSGSRIVNQINLGSTTEFFSGASVSSESYGMGVNIENGWTTASKSSSGGDTPVSPTSWDLSNIVIGRPNSEL